MKQQREDLDMGTERVDDIHAFRDFLDEQLANGGVYLTPAQALTSGRFKTPVRTRSTKSLRPLRRGFADIEAGRVKPAREALAELRRKHNLPELS